MKGRNMITFRADSPYLYCGSEIEYRWTRSHTVNVYQNGREIDCFTLFPSDGSLPTQLEILQAVMRYDNSLIICERCGNPCADAAPKDWNAPLWCDDCRS